MPFPPVPLPVRAAAPSDGLCCGEGISAPMPGMAREARQHPQYRDDDRNDHGHRLPSSVSKLAEPVYSFRDGQRYWSTALVDSRHWRLTDGENLHGHQ